MVKLLNRIYRKKNDDVYVDTGLGRITMGQVGYAYEDYITIKTSGNPVIRFNLIKAMFKELQAPSDLDYDDYE